MKTLLFALFVTLFAAGCKQKCITCTRVSILTASTALPDYPKTESTVVEYCDQEVDQIVDIYSGTTNDTLPDSTVITINYTTTCVE